MRCEEQFYRITIGLQMLQFLFRFTVIMNLLFYEILTRSKMSTSQQRSLLTEETSYGLKGNTDGAAEDKTEAVQQSQKLWRSKRLGNLQELQLSLRREVNHSKRDYVR